MFQLSVLGRAEPLSIMPRGLGGRLALALALLSTTTLLSSGLSLLTANSLEEQLLQMRLHDVPALDASAKMNEQVSFVVATVPRVAGADSQVVRERALQAVHIAIEEMSSIMLDLPDYNHYFSESIGQIENSLDLLDQNVTEYQLARRRFDQLLLEFQRDWQEAQLAFSHHYVQHPNWTEINGVLQHQRGLLAKLSSDDSFNQLDDTIFQLEYLNQRNSEVLQGDYFPKRSAASENSLQVLLGLRAGFSRDGSLFQAKNTLLDISYQQLFLLQTSQNSLQQLSNQISQNTWRSNQSIGRAIANTQSLLMTNNRASVALSLFSLLAAAIISWFYVKKNILGRVKTLQSRMREIASGELQSPIAIGGSDEVADMAKDLRHFQQTAIKVERGNRLLALEIDERRATEQRLLSTQNELIQAAKLAALGELSVGIAHEMNQPLTAIRSHLYSAKKCLEFQQIERCAANLEKAEELMGKTAVLMSHLKTFARQSDGKLVATDIHRVVRDASVLLTSRFDQQRCGFAYEAGDDCLVWANPVRLEQVLVNLLSNALDATAAASEPRIEIRLSLIQDAVELSISDNGSGIDPELLDAIFDPFYTTKPPGKGLGLGLSIAYSIIRDFGGRLQARTGRDNGSEMVITLKRAEEA